MPIHSNVPDLLRESVSEYLEIARYAISARKPVGGCYGWPGALLLLTIIDVIGSYHRGNREFTVLVDGKAKRIRSDGDHFLVINSAYYGLNLSGGQIDAIYENFRCPLVHNASIAPGQLLSVGGADEPAFYLRGKTVDGIGLGGLLALSEKAVQRFLLKADSLATSAQAIAIMKKSPRGA